MTPTVITGDCRLAMPMLDAESFDAIVTDPPYDLLQVSRNGSGRSNPGPGPYGRTNGTGGFMGMKWDGTGVAFEPETWVAALRLLKPGGHLVAFGGTRTFHRLTCAIEDAGFEIRDCLSWLYGSGFPKSLDVSKAIDKAAGAERVVVGRRPIAYSDSDCWGTPNSNSDGGFDGSLYEPGLQGNSRGGSRPVTAPATSNAEVWNGWGTALKPAWEPIILARKPLGASTVAANVLRHGTGALNVDGCRIQGAPVTINRLEQWSGFGQVKRPDYESTQSNAGRWPANVVLDEAAAAGLDEQSGTLTSGANPTRRGTDKFRGIYAAFSGQEKCEPARGVDVGGASRFFYTAKASGSERNERTRQSGIVNNHPTVKPVDLMRWLCRLVTPPGGHILDPFAGSGSTLVAALLEGFDSTGIEQSPDYVAIIQARVDGIQIGGLL